MAIVSSIKRKVSLYLFPIKETEPKEAYNMWAENYDTQPDNLMLAVDEEIFSALLQKVSLKDKVVVDIGCGTGRHWQKMYASKPKRVIGFDVSETMLETLRKKFPTAETHCLQNSNRILIENCSCDIIVSTLTLAHIENIESAIAEWSRVLRTGGTLIITDYHPDLLAVGGDRTFKYNGGKISVKNYVYTVSKIKQLATGLGFELVEFNERKIDEAVKSYYERQHAIHVFERFKNMPLIYGACFNKLK